MKASKVIRIFIYLSLAGLALYALFRLLSHDEDDPYYYYGDSMYKGDDGEPIRYESDEEKAARKAKRYEEPVVPEGYAHMVH